MPEPGPAHRELDVFAGSWATSGKVWATPDAEPTEFTATDDYEWLPGGFFLAHHVAAQMGETEVRALEIFRVEGDGYVLESYDNQGGHVVSRAKLDGDTWTIESDSERFTGTFVFGGAILSGSWERRIGQDWVRWMGVTLVKKT